MKKTYLFLCLTFVFGISVKTQAQEAPPEVNLKHQWTFDDGTANDSKGTVNGVLEGGATVTNKALNVSSGGYVSLDASELAINTYSELTVETWFTSSLNANGSFHMLYYFGDTDSGGGGINYTCITPARGNNVSRGMISTGTEGSGAENGVNGPEYDDGVLHHMVSVINAMSITFYIDGENMGTADLTNGNSLASIGSQFAYFAKGGYSADPTWKGNIHKISVYDKALTDENIIYMYQHGAEEQPVISASVSSLAFDLSYNAKVISVTAANLSDNITITAPAGITVRPTTLPANSVNAELEIVYNSTEPIDGIINLTSGTTVASFPVKAVSDATCFVPLYTDFVNLITEPGMNSLTSFEGWGNKEVVTINTDPANVYCGASSIKIGDGINGGSGSLDFHFRRDASPLQPNTTYKVKFMVKTDGPFQFGVERIDVDNPANNVIIKPIDTNGEWRPFELVFATGPNMADDVVIYLNDWNITGKTAYTDNWEMYATPDQVITPTITTLAFDPEFTNNTFTVTAGNLQDDITITAPAGITVVPSTLPASAASEVVSITYDGTTVVDGNITMASGLATANVRVKSSTNSCLTPLYTDRPNLIPDPYLNSLSNFGGWENRKMINAVEFPDSVYCGSHCCVITNRGDIEVPLTDKLVPNYNYVAKAMIRTVGGTFRMGINGYDKSLSGDLIQSINTLGIWEEVTFSFHTGDSINVTPVIFFNNDSESGKIGYLDNWELYAVDAYTAVSTVKYSFNNVYVTGGKIVTEFEMNQSGNVELSVYNAQGALMSTERTQAFSGKNTKTLSAQLPSGVYIVKISQNGQSNFKKIIKY